MICARLAQTPRTDDVPQGGIGSSVLFTEDSALGPEPLLWASPKRPGMNGVSHSGRVREALSGSAMVVRTRRQVAVVQCD